MKNAFRILALVFSFCLISQPGFAASTAMVGTGSKAGVYYPVCRAICQIVNMKSGKYGFQYKAKKSHGSVSNINSVLNGTMELGFAQSDRQYEAYNGLGEWRSTGPQKNLRAVFSVYAEAITLVASSQSNIHSLQDLKGKTVNVGHRGSGQYKNAQDVLGAAGIKLSDIKPKQSNAADNKKLIQKNQIDAFFYTVGHPNKMIEKLSKNLKISIIPITGSGVDSLIRKYPYYTKTRIPMNFYPSASPHGTVSSIGVTATVVTSQKITDHVIYSLVKEIFENINDLKRCHPALRGLNKREMLQGLSAPIHKGALAYYREVGLLH